MGVSVSGLQRRAERGELDGEEQERRRRRTAVGRHPDRAAIEQLVRVGKSPGWISAWLAERYPVEEDNPDDPTGENPLRHPDWRRHRRLQVKAQLIERYRAQWMSDCAPGVDVVPEEVEDLIGRAFPAPANIPWELDVLAVQTRAAQVMLATQMGVDAENEMGVSESAIELSRLVGEHAEKSVNLKSQLGHPGYEAAPERQQIDLNQRAVNVQLHGRVDSEGQPVPVEPQKVELLSSLMERTPEEIDKLLQAASAIQPPPDIDVTPTEEEDE